MSWMAKITSAAAAAVGERQLLCRTQQSRGIRVKVYDGNVERALTVLQRKMQSSGMERLIKKTQRTHLKNSEKRVLAHKNLLHRVKAEDLARKLQDILHKKISSLQVCCAAPNPHRRRNLSQMETVRLRLAFDKSLRNSDGFKRYWVVVKPQHRTMSDFCNYLLDVFQLRNSCPEGLLLSMEGFFLPPFESIRLLNDRDLVRVKRNEKANLGTMEFVGNLRLENEEFKEVKKVSKKRKAMEEVGSSSKKKKKKKEKERSSSGDRKAKKALSLIDGDKKDEEDDPKDSQRHQNAKKSSEPNSVINGHVDVSCTPSETTKEEEKQLSVTSYEKSKNHKVNEEHTAEDSEEVDVDNQEADHDSDKDDEVAPVVIRPGHIRFAPLDNGNMNMIASLLHYVQYLAVCPLTRFFIPGCADNGYGTSSSQDDPSSSHEPSGSPVCKQIIDFDKLPPYSNSPKEADIIAYRIVQLTSSWNPEVSSYLVGKISHFNPESNMIKLIAIPKYPLIPATEIVDDEAPEVLQETCILQEDGSLEIEFSSLLEVRVVKNQNSTSSAEPVEVKQKHSTSNHATGQERRESTNHRDEISRRVHSQEEDDWDISESSGRDQWTLKALRRSALGPTMALLRSQNEI
ncbi:COIL [Linum grandiflorum]